MVPLDDLSTNDIERMADEEFWNYARVRADIAPQISSQESNYHDHYLECELSCGTCLIPLHAIVEVLPSSRQVTHLPLIPTWMPGLFAWRGKSIPLIDLDMYLCGINFALPGGMFLITNYSDKTVGLLVPAIGLTTTIQFEQVNPSIEPSVSYMPIRAGVIRGVYAEEPVLDIAALLSDIVQQIGMGVHYG
jgi:chemotaxis signal transduction protein